MTLKRSTTTELVSNFNVDESKPDKIPLTKNNVMERDSAPMTAEEWKKARRVPRVTTLRQALEMTQEKFASAFGIPIGTLRDWEQGRSEPDASARSYLLAIAGDAKAVAKAHADGAASPFGL